MLLDYAKPKTPNDSRRARRIIAIALVAVLILLAVLYGVAIVLTMRG